MSLENRVTMLESNVQSLTFAMSAINESLQSIQSTQEEILSICRHKHGKWFSIFGNKNGNGRIHR